MPVRSPLRPPAAPPAWSLWGVVMALALAGLIASVASSIIGRAGALYYVGVVARFVVLVGLLIALAIVLSILAVAALFRPGRRRVVVHETMQPGHVSLWPRGGGA